MEKRLAVVSGGAQGIGLAIVELLATSGFQVVALDLRDSVLSAAGSLAGRGLDVQGRVVDVTRRDEVEAALRDYPDINTIVCAAGIILVRPFADVSDEEFRRVVDVNLFGTFILTQVGLRAMKPGGRIIMISSRGVLGGANTSPYIASKAAVVGLMRALAVELLDRSITVNVVAPGFTETGFVSAFPKEMYDAAVSREVNGRPAQASQIAPAVAFLASREADYVTGQTLFVDGGRSLGSFTAA